VIRRWIALMREKAIPSVYVSLDTSGDEGESLLRDALARLIRSRPSLNTNAGPALIFGASLRG
jgi:hypothetical protein